MELWVRNQNKDFLEKCGGLYIAHTDKNIWSIINSITMTIYGKYSTKERALEVLDEIQHKLITLCDSMNRHLYVYEMPEE